MSQPITKPTPLPDLMERYRDYAMMVQNLCSKTIHDRLAYINRLCDFLGSP